MMGDEMVNALFLKFQEQYDSASRWSYIVILGALVFHLMTFTQFVDLSKQIHFAQVEQDRLSNLYNAVDSIDTGLTGLKDSIIESLDVRFEKMMDDLKDDFGYLDREISEIRTPVTERFTGPIPDSILVEGFHTAMQIQQPTAPVESSRKSFALSDDLKLEIKNAATLTGLRSALSPVIEQQIIGARFDDMNRIWRDNEIPKTKKKINQIENRLARAKSFSTKDYPAWASIKKSLEKVDQVVGQISFEPPQEPNWWMTVSGKQQRFDDMSGSILLGLSKAFKQSRSIQHINAEVRSALDQQKKLSHQLDTKIDQIEEGFAQQESKLSELNKLFALISLDLNHVILMFPLFLGVLLAATTFWTACRYKELILLSKAIPHDNSNSFITWLSLRSSLPLTAQPESVLVKRSKQRNLILGWAFRCLLFWAWILLVCLQLAQWPEVDLSRIISYSIVAAILVAVSDGYRLWVRRIHLWPTTTMNGPANYSSGAAGEGVDN